MALLIHKIRRLLLPWRNYSYINSLDDGYRKGALNMTKRKWAKEEVEEYRKNQYSYFYFNKQDSNFVVSKAYGFGFTFNWANPISWVFIAAIIGLLVFREFY
jgi:uncharacterized membrane protein